MEMPELKSTNTTRERNGTLCSTGLSNAANETYAPWNERMTHDLVPKMKVGVEGVAFPQHGECRWEFKIVQMNIGAHSKTSRVGATLTTFDPSHICWHYPVKENDSIINFYHKLFTSSHYHLRSTRTNKDSKSKMTKERDQKMKETRKKY
jgi:hypothetical protein